LRFPGFSGEWEKVKMGNLFDIGSSKRVFESQWRSSGVPFYRTREIVSLINGTPFASPIYIDEDLFKELIEKYGSIEKDDMLVTGVGTIGQMFVVPETNKFYFKDGNVIWFKHNPSISSQFIKQLFSTNSIINQIQNNASITTVATYTIDGAKKTNAFIPSKDEQDKIADFLTLIDQRIAIQNKVIEDLKKLKSALGEKIIKQVQGKQISLRDILEERKEKSIENNQYEVLSSTVTGIYSQREYFNKDIASANNSGYKIVRRGDIVLSPQNLWMGNINYNDRFEKGIVSPSYRVFSIRSVFDERYVAFLLKTKKALWAYSLVSEQGASIVRRNLNYESFLEISLKIPSYDKQKEIGEVIAAVSNKLLLEQSLFHSINRQKRFLLGNLFI